MRTRWICALFFALLDLLVGLRGSVGAATDPAWAMPALISPVKVAGEARIGGGCPGFSWTLVPSARRYELAVYEVLGLSEAEPQRGEPILRREFPAGATAWTPNLDECLPPGRYGWAVVADGTAPSWSEPGLFRVEGEVPESRRPEIPSAGRRELTPRSQPTVTAVSMSAAAPLSASAPAAPRAVFGSAWVPPTCSGSEFADVLAGDPYCPWIKQAALDGILGGCAGGKYCPDSPVTRKQLARALERVIRGTDSWRPELGDGTVANQTPRFNDNTVQANGAGRPSITIGVDGLGLISYYDTVTDDLKVNHCSNLACSPRIVTPIDTTGDVGEFSSITGYFGARPSSSA